VNQVLGLLLPMLIFSTLSKFAASNAAPPAPSLPRFKKEPLGLVNIVFVVVISLMLQPIMMLLSAVASLFLPNPVTGLISDMVFLPLPTALIIVALTPAICEELVFRGFIQSRYEKQPMAVTAIVNGLFFGIIHMNLHQFTYAFVMGIVFAYMVYITRSIFSAILAHFVVNATQYTLGYSAYQQLGPVTSPPDGDALLTAILEIGEVALITFPLVVGLFYVFIRYNTLRHPAEAAIEEEKPGHPFGLAFWAVLLVYGLLLFIFSVNT